jgi:hypothetical protein
MDLRSNKTRGNDGDKLLHKKWFSWQFCNSVSRENGQNPCPNIVKKSYTLFLRSIQLRNQGREEKVRDGLYQLKNKKKYRKKKIYKDGKISCLILL